MTSSPFTRRTILASSAVLASSTALAACSSDGDAGEDSAIADQIAEPDENINPEGLPIVDEATTISFMTRRPNASAEDWNEVAAAQEMQKLTNLEVDWGLVPEESAIERRNLMLTSGDYPEAFYRTGIPGGDIAKYGEQGVFVPLNELIDTYMPNLTARMEEHPAIRTGLTFPDGNIYSLPGIYDPETLGLRHQTKLWARQDWLDRFGMSAPETLEEFQAYLDEAVGTVDGAIGLSAQGIGSIMVCLYGAFGISNQGTDAGLVDLDPDSSAVRYFPATEGYRELLTYLNGLHGKGLLQPDVFSSDVAAFTANGTEGLLAACAVQAPAGYFGAEGENYIALKPLVKEAGADPAWHAVRSELASIGNFVMTDRAEHPIEIARWMDSWYGEDGAKLFFLGIEGESYQETDGRYELIPELLEGTSVDEALKPYVLYLGGSYPGWATDTWFRGVETSEQSTDGAKVVEPFALKEVWPAFTFSAEESRQITTIGNDIAKYADESLAAFVTGDRSLDEWDDHLATFEQIGLPDYEKAHQSAYDRRQ
jgi:putative aldouronate transport system substrate-binding protein